MCTWTRVVAFIGLAVSSGCGNEDIWMGAAAGSLQQADQWGAADAPTVFSADLVLRLEELPLEGHASSMPWVGSDWPVYRDNINFRWAADGTPAPSEKYDVAFGGGGQTPNAVSLYHGIDSAQEQLTCASSSECAASEVCAMRDGAQVGRCVPTSWGASRGWSAAALLVPEPQHEVTRENTVFSVQDIKALATVAYAGTSVAAGVAVGNPGTFHVLLTNLLGSEGRPVVADRTFDEEVASTPVVGYRIVEKRRVSGREANQIIGGRIELNVYPRKYLYNADARALYFVRVVVDSLTPAPSSLGGNLAGNVAQFTLGDEYSYILEIDRRGDVIGGEWAHESMGGASGTHPDFLWDPRGLTAGDEETLAIAGGAIDFSHIQALLEESIAPCPGCMP